jgi:hypothetical protein
VVGDCVGIGDTAKDGNAETAFVGAPVNTADGFGEGLGLPVIGCNAGALVFDSGDEGKAVLSFCGTVVDIGAGPVAGRLVGENTDSTVVVGARDTSPTVGAGLGCVPSPSGPELVNGTSLLLRSGFPYATPSPIAKGATISKQARIPYCRILNRSRRCHCASPSGSEEPVWALAKPDSMSPSFLFPDGRKSGGMQEVPTAFSAGFTRTTSLLSSNMEAGLEDFLAAAIFASNSDRSDSTAFQTSKNSVVSVLSRTASLKLFMTDCSLGDSLALRLGAVRSAADADFLVGACSARVGGEGVVIRLRANNDAR